MGKSKDKEPNAEFEFDLDFADRGQRTVLDGDEVDNILSNSSHEQFMALKTGDEKKKGKYDDDDRSTKSGKMKKKKKKNKLGDSKASLVDDDASVRSKKKSKKIKKKKGDGDDDDDKSVKSMRSTRSKRTVKKAKSKSKLTLDDDAASKDRKRVSELELENAALLEETAAVRRQLNESEKALKKALSEQNPQQVNIDLQRELEQYEDAVIEKDELIKKLTAAVDTQLDKVENLEAKLVNAEEEFCKMEDEMKEMEFIIEDLRGKPPSQINLDDDAKSPSAHGKTLDEEILEQLDEREREIEKREKELLEKEDLILDRETSVKQQEDELKQKRTSLLNPQDSFDNVGKESSADVGALEAKIKELESENDGLTEELAVLRSYDTGIAANDTSSHQKDDELRTLKAQLADLNEENEILHQELEGLKYLGNTNEEERESLRGDFEKKMADAKLENEILRQELDGFKERKNAELETLREQMKQLKMQKNHAEASSRQMRRMESMRMTEEESVVEDEEFGLEVEVEIAELREKIVEQEAYAKKLKQEIGTHMDEKEDLKQELEERDIEMKNLEGQLSANKETAAKKMKQKDETITFMQQSMMQIMQEKQELDKKLRGSNLNSKQSEIQAQMMAQRAEDSEAEKAKFEAINAELRKLDDENRQLEQELNQFKYDSSLKLKEKESAVLELQDELRDLKWELGAREKGADYITLLKDTKERKNQLKNARRDLKEAEEKILELEMQNREILSGRKDLEKEIDALNNGEQAEQISGMKRQIKSLKQHNATLEQKLETQSRESEDLLVEKEAKIQILQYEMHKLKNAPPPQSRGLLSGFGRRNNESEANSAPANNGSAEVDNGSKPKTENAPAPAPRLGWGGLFGGRKEAPPTNENRIGELPSIKSAAPPTEGGFESNATLL